jgi:hypothetical protein
MGKGIRLKNAITIIVMASFLILLFTWASNEFLLPRRGLKSDFYWLWYGGRSLIEQKNPYSHEATLEIQMNLFHKHLEPGEYAHPFPFPAYQTVLFLPFGLLPYPTALLLWIGLQFPMLFTALYLIKLFIGMKLYKLESGLLFLAGSIGFMYPLVSYALGQLSILMLTLLVLMFYFLLVDRPKLAGMVLAFIAIRPDIFLIACINAIVFRWNSKQDIKSIGISTSTILIAANIVTVAVFGFWYPDWVKIIGYYSANNPFVHWPLEHLPNMGTRTALLLTFLIYFAWRIVQFIKKPDKKQKLLMISATLIIYQLVTKVTGTYYMTLLLIPTLILMYLYSEYKLRWVMWVFIFSPWLWYLFIENSYPWLSILLVPLSLLILQITYETIDKYRMAVSSIYTVPNKPHEIRGT